jgi:acid stress-induced BolA-like protein IbaG/YrbA
MTLEEVQKKIELGIDQSQVTMEGDGCNCSVVVVSPFFEGLSLLQRQRAVLALVSEEIRSGELHALSVKTYTPDER